MSSSCAVVRHSDSEGKAASSVASESASYRDRYTPTPLFGTLDDQRKPKYRQHAEQLSDDELLDWCESKYREYSYSYATLVVIRSMGFDNPFKSDDEEYGWGPLESEIRAMYVYTSTARSTLEYAILSSRRDAYLLAYEYVSIWNDEYFQRMEDLLIRIAGEGFGRPNAEEKIDLSSLY